MLLSRPSDVDELLSVLDGILPVVRKLGEKVIRNCAAKLKPHFLKLSQSVASFSNNSSKVVDSICQESFGGITQNNTNSGEIMESAKVEEMRLFPEEGTAPEKILNSVKSNGIGESTLDPLIQSKSLNRLFTAIYPNQLLQLTKMFQERQNENSNCNLTKRGRFSSKLSAAKQSVSPLQEKVSKVVDKSCSPKDIELKESDSEDSANVKQTTASKAWPKRKQVTVTSTSTSKETDKEPTAKSGTAAGSGHRRRGRPPKAASSNLHDTTSSWSKITERVASKLKDGIAEPDPKLKEELVKPKDSMMANQCTNIPGTEVKDDDSKSGRKSIDGTFKFVGRKVRRDSLKGKPISDNSDSVLKIKGVTSSESGIVTKANIASGKGRVKFRGSEKPRKVWPNLSGMPRSDASTGQKRKRKR
ncbi:hypothetical protein ZIOFF_054422 [Zingiber officinale]|uniref:Uncharacterized protein n=1 Tax=Zingiber officinale TaxID=94328 RepID=A0A8J5FKC9_ZINOF|nr:hypothetical protein ZIOFF_054422 [Zingiber officinale]